MVLINLFRARTASSTVLKSPKHILSCLYFRLALNWPVFLINRTPRYPVPELIRLLCFGILSPVCTSEKGSELEQTEHD